MRIVLLFDLPSVTNSDKRVYRKFHRYLETEGFIMMQESVYTKLSLNGSTTKAIIQRVRNNAPKKGLIEVLAITEKQYTQIEFIAGKHHTSQIDSEERLIVI
ncbi:MAG: CRISPR-associated endonuclease Cas2 [Erysipelotrichaceae bacterium]